MQKDRNEPLFRLDPREKLVRGERRKRHWGRILVLAAVALCAAGGILLMLPSPRAVSALSAKKAEKEALLSRPSAEILRAEFVCGGDSYALVRTGQEWRLEGREDFSLDQRTAARVMAQCSSVSGTGIERGEQSGADYGFDHAGKQLTLTYTDGEKRVFTVGDLSPVGGYYACVNGGERTALIPESVIAAVFSGLNALHTVDTPRLNEPLAPVRILIEKAWDGQFSRVLEILKTEAPVLSGSGYRIVFPFEYETDTEQTAQLIESLQQIEANGYLGRAEEDPQKTARGFRVTLCDRTEKTVSLLLTAGPEGGDLRLFFDGGSDAYAVDMQKVRFLDALEPALLADRFAALIALDRVESLLIRSEGESWLLEPAADGTYVNGVPVDGIGFRLFYQELCSLTADDIAAGEGSGQEARAFVFRLRDRTEPYTVVFSELDRDHFLVTRDGHSLMMIGKNKVDAVIRKLKTLDPGSAKE